MIEIVNLSNNGVQGNLYHKNIEGGIWKIPVLDVGESACLARKTIHNRLLKIQSLLDKSKIKVLPSNPPKEYLN